MSSIEKEIDKLGRVVLPKNYRDSLDIKNNDKVIISLEDSKIIIYRSEKRCALCGEKIDKTETVRLCVSCIAKIKSL